MKYNQREIMTRAWQLRKANGYSMSKAWAIAKTVAEMDREEAAMEASKTFNADQLVAVGGKLWENENCHRVYFNKSEILSS